MDVLSFKVLCNIEEDCCGKISGIAFDGRFFYLTLPNQNEIHVYNESCRITDRIQTSRGYESICYDSRSRCFWASSSRGQHIYKLDHECSEIDSIKVRSGDLPAVLTGITCMPDPDDLLIATAGWIALTQKETPHEMDIIKEFESAARVGVAASNEKVFHLVCGAHGDTITAESRGQEQIYSLPAEFRAHDIAAGENGVLYVLATKNCNCPCIIKCTPSGGSDPCSDTCDDCKQCKPCPEPEDCSHGAKDIIESIALIETAISHILNAEGEKLQKVLVCSCDVCELLKVNESIRETITGITHLEHVLYDKLRIAESLCRKPGPRPCGRCLDKT